MSPEPAEVAQEICAVVVTYQPDACLSGRLSLVAEQVKQVIVIDNGSSPELMLQLEPLVAAKTVELVANESNLGIAAALNRGLDIASKRGFKWALTLDQDSVPDAAMVSRLRSSLASYSRPERVAIVGPTIVLPGLPEKRRHWSWVRAHPALPVLFQRVRCSGGDRDDVSFTISSGALTSLDIYHRVGGFREEYFIDFVDTDYCLRTKAAGFHILLSADAVLSHNLGAMREVDVTGIRMRARFHDATRLYYQYRNRLPTLRRYGTTFPHWLLYEVLSSLVNLLRIVLFENDRRAKLRACSVGTWHGLIGRMGPR